MSVKIIDKEVLREGEWPTHVEGVSAYRKITRIIRESTRESEFGIVGEEHAVRRYDYTVTDVMDRTLHLVGGFGGGFGGSVGVSKRFDGWTGLLERTDGDLIATERKDVVPVKIAALGKPELASYLCVIHEMSYEEAGEAVGVSPHTAKQYLRDIGRRRRRKSS